jgi:hypothetical protein
MEIQSSPEVKAADEILALVRSTEVGGERGDMAAAAMFGSYLNAYRRLSRIRDLARQGAGAEAFILARSLLTMIARAMWVDQPAATEDRKTRFEIWLKRELEDELREAEGLLSLGFDAPSDLAELRERLEGMRDVARMPDDRRLLVDELGLDAHYRRLYVPASSHVHFSLRSAIDEVRAAAADGETLPFDRPNSALAREALLLSLFTYGLFIEASDRTVQHHLGPQALEVIEASLSGAKNN